MTAMMNEFNRDKDVQIIHNIQKNYLLSCLTFSEECKIKRSVRVLKRPRKPNNNVTEDPRRFIEINGLSFEGVIRLLQMITYYKFVLVKNVAERNTLEFRLLIKPY